MAPSAPASGEKSLVTTLQEVGFLPLTTHNILYYYSPIFGASGYTLLSINVMNPNLVTRLFPKRDVTNVLLFSSLIGTGLYIYDRRHLVAAPTNWRIAYSAFGSVMFCFGSVLLWAVLRSVLPENKLLCTITGMSSGITLIRMGRNYLQFVDSMISGSK